MLLNIIIEVGGGDALKILDLLTPLTYMIYTFQQ